MESKIEAGKFYVCEYPIGLGGVLLFVAKAIKEPYKKINGQIVVDIINPFGYTYDEMKEEYFVRKASEKEITDFRQGRGLID